MPEIYYDVGELLLVLKNKYGNVRNFIKTNKEFNDRAIFRLFHGNCKKPFKNIKLLGRVCGKLSVNLTDISYPVDSVPKKTKKQKRSEELEQAKNN